MKKSILIVDDSNAARMLLEGILLEAGYNIELADSGLHAVASLKKNLPDLILLDIFLGDLSGLEVCKLVKANEHTKEIPIILISGRAVAAEWADGLKMGAVDCILKPFNHMELVVRVHAHLALSDSIKLLKQTEISLRISNEKLEIETRERKHLEEQNRIKERLSLACRAGEIGIWEFDILANKLIWDDQMFKLYGFTPEMFTGTYEALKAGVHPEDLQKYEIELWMAIREEKDFDTEYRVIWTDGTVHFIQNLAKLRKDDFNQAVTLLGTSYDITERKQLEFKLENQKEHLESLVEKRTYELSQALKVAKLVQQDLRIGAVAFESQEAMMITGAQNTILNVNGAFTKITGYTAMEVIGKKPSIFKSGRHDKAFYEDIWDAITNTGVWQGEIWDKRKDGEIYPKLSTISAVKNENGVITHYVHSHLDISEPKKAQEELTERNRFIESLMDLSPSIIYIFDLIEQKNIYSNDGIQKLLGYSIEEIQSMENKLISILMHPDDLSKYFDTTIPQYQSAEDNEQIVHQYRMKHKTGVWRWLESAEAIYKRQPNGSPKQIFGTVHDITDKKLGEDALKSLATNFAKLSGKDFFCEISKHIATVAGLDCVFVGEIDSLKENITVQGGYFLGDRLEMRYALANTPCEKVMEKSFRFHPNSVQSLFPKDLDLVQMKAQSYMGAPILDKKSNPIGLLVAIHSKEMSSSDSVANLFNIFIERVTAEMLRDMAEKALGASEELYRNMIQILPEGILIFTNGKIVYANDSMCKILDASSNNDLIGLSPIKLIHPDFREIAIDRIQRGLKENKVGEPIEYIVITLNEKHRHVISTGIPFVYNGEQSVMAVITDITERKQVELDLAKHKNRLEELVQERTTDLQETIERLKETQSQLVQSEKLASIGILTAGIAHEINNPINYINSSIVALKSEVNDIKKFLQIYEKATPDNIKEILNEIEKLKESVNLSDSIEGIHLLSNNISVGAKKTADIVQSLRIFSRTDSDIPELADVNENIDSTLILLHNEYKDRIEIIKKYEQLPLLKCFPGKLNQVFMNLLANAIQSIKGNGTIVIKTMLLSSGLPFFKEEQILISIHDTGSGIPIEIQNKIFEPFFTTKETGKGTGLGLSISYGIIEQHKGKLEFTSVAGKGTEFRIYLPMLN